jgi:hypothetical protein
MAQTPLLPGGRKPFAGESSEASLVVRGVLSATVTHLPEAAVMVAVSWPNQPAALFGGKVPAMACSGLYWRLDDLLARNSE